MANIIIDMTVSDYSDAAVCNEQSLIHQTQMKQFKAIIKRQIGNIKDYDSEHKHTLHNTISIFGNRGAGKTTFLLTALDQIEKDYAHEAMVLSPLDPSLIECKQHPFINILAAIHEKVEQFKNDNPRKKHDYRDDLERYNDIYKKVLKGLPFIDGVGSDDLYKDWDDELFVSIQGMEKAEASNNLEQNFHEYINRTLRLLNKKCIVISFDDIDTHFTKGFEILEVIRKYLTSDQLITILTGDLELYSKLVRKASWSCFDLDYLRKECEYGDKDKRDFSSMVNHIENQYLLKLLKPENRIQLFTIGEVTEEYGTTIKIKFNDEKELDLPNCYEILTSKLRFSQDSKVLYYFFISLSLRAQLRLFKLIQRIKIDSDFANDRNRIVQSFVSIFSNDINQKASNSRALLSKDKHYILEMQKFLINSGVLHECCDFMPHTTDETFNKALLAISAQFNILVQKHAFMIFDFWIRICYLNYITKDLEFGSPNDSLKKIIKFTFLDGQNNLTQCIGRAEAYYQGIRKYNLDNKPTENFPGSFMVKEISYTSEHYKLASLILHSIIDEDKHQKNFASLYKLISVIRDLIYSYNKQDGHKYEMLFNRLTQIRSYLEPIKNEPNSYEEKFIDKDDYDVATSFKDSQLYDVIVDLFSDWIEEFQSILKDEDSDEKENKNVKYSTPQFLNRIFTRTYFTLINLNKDVRFTNLGDKFSTYLIAFLNASLVEESILLNRKNIMLDNTSNLVEYFRNNITTDNNLKHCLFTVALLKCPLIRLFLNPSLTLAIDTLLNNEEDSLFSVYWEQFRYEELDRRIISVEHDLESYDKIINSLLCGKNSIEKSMHGHDQSVVQNNKMDSMQESTYTTPLFIDLSPFEDPIYIVSPLYDRYSNLQMREELTSKIQKYSIKKLDKQKELTIINSKMNNIASFIKRPEKENANKIKNTKYIRIKKEKINKANYDEEIQSFFNYLCTIKTI